MEEQARPTLDNPLYLCLSEGVAESPRSAKDRDAALSKSDSEGDRHGVLCGAVAEPDGAASAAPCISVVTLSGEAVLYVPLNQAGSLHAAVMSHFDKLDELVAFSFVCSEALPQLARDDALLSDASGRTVTVVVNGRIGVHQLLEGLMSMGGSRNSRRLKKRMPDDVDEFLGKTLQELYRECSSVGGYIEMARVVTLWEQLQRLDPVRPLRKRDIVELLGRCAVVDRPSALRQLIGLHNEGKLALDVRRYTRLGREVGMTLRVPQRRGWGG